MRLAAQNYSQLRLTVKRGGTALYVSRCKRRRRRARLRRQLDPTRG
jgi:hypothetical protein